MGDENNKILFIHLLRKEEEADEGEEATPQVEGKALGTPGLPKPSNNPRDNESYCPWDDKLGEDVRRQRPWRSCWPAAQAMILQSQTPTNIVSLSVNRCSRRRAAKPSPSAARPITPMP